MINRGNKTGAIRKTPLIRVKDGAALNPVCIYNMRAAGDVEVRDETEVRARRRTTRNGRGCGSCQ